MRSSGRSAYLCADAPHRRDRHPEEKVTDTMSTRLAVAPQSTMEGDRRSPTKRVAVTSRCDLRIVELYDMPRERAPSLVVDVNRALAVASPALLRRKRAALER
jgi:hypothetical protein